MHLLFCVKNLILSTDHSRYVINSNKRRRNQAAVKMNIHGPSDSNDLESQLLQQFSCMSTSSKDDLIKEFQRLLAPNQLNNDESAFFLDMNNWNLQQAICSYFDYDAHKLMAGRALPSMTFISDVTIGDGEEVPPNTPFVKTWRILNSGI